MSRGGQANFHRPARGRRLFPWSLSDVNSLLSPGSGADLSSVVREAAMNALRSEFPDLTVTGAWHPAAIKVSNRHFEAALSKVAPSVSKKVSALGLVISNE